MSRDVFLFDIENEKALGFNTGLDSRTFAQVKFAQFITEPGFIVNIGENASIASWKASGVIEYADKTMVVWGPPFKGDRLDLLLHDRENTEQALASIACWIQTILAVQTQAPPGFVPWPCGAIVSSDAVFFVPPNLALGCMMRDETTRTTSGKWYVHPDLNDTQGTMLTAAAFTAAAMLYHVFAGTPPFPATDEITLNEDMREGNFLPVRLAVPGLNEQLAALIQNALMPPEKKSGNRLDAKMILDSFLEFLQTNSPAVSAAPLLQPLSDAERLLLEKEKSQFLKVKKASVNTKRFVMRNMIILLGSIAAVILVVTMNLCTMR